VVQFFFVATFTRWEFMSPFAIIALFATTLAIAVFAPTFPSSRRIRFVIAGVAFLAMILANFLVSDLVQRRASVRGSEQLDYLVDESERLLKQGQTQILVDTYQDYQAYRKQDDSSVPRVLGAADRAAWLAQKIHEKEVEHQLDKKP
jgi:hypothetical protein